jgi:hypothetical protein
MVKCSIRTYKRLKGKTRYVWKNFTHSGRNLTPKGTGKKKALSQKKKIYEYYQGDRIVKCKKDFYKK